jgi:hypothetical protein
MVHGVGDNGGVRRVLGQLAALGIAVCAAVLAPVVAAAHDVEPSSKIVSSHLNLGLFPTARLARHRLAANLDLFLAGFDAKSQAVLKKALTPDDAAIWPQLIAGAVQVRHEAGRTGETLWFNPVFDAGLVIRWRGESTRWRVTDAWWVLGRDIRGDRAQRRPLPIGSVNAPILRGETLDAVREFRIASAKNWRPPKPRPGAAAEVVSRVQAAQAAINALQAAPGHDHSVWTARTLLSFSGPETSGLGTGLTRSLESLSPETRLTLRWVSAYSGGDADWTLVTQSPFAPGQAWFVAFSAPTDATAAQVVNISRIVFALPEARP